jgi:hypothetical protein
MELVLVSDSNCVVCGAMEPFVDESSHQNGRKNTPLLEWRRKLQ